MPKDRLVLVLTILLGFNNLLLEKWINRNWSVLDCLHSFVSLFTDEDREGSRGLMITYDPPGPDAPNQANPNQFPVNTQEICYINRFFKKLWALIKVVASCLKKNKTVGVAGWRAAAVQNGRNSTERDQQLEYPTSVLLSLFVCMEVQFNRRLHESLWRAKNNTKGSRAMLMVALQNVRHHVLIRATYSMDRTKAELKDVSLPQRFCRLTLRSKSYFK